MEEIWQRYKDTVYLVSNYGRCKSTKFYEKYNNPHKLKNSEKNFFRFYNSKTNTSKTHLVEEVVAELFVSNPNCYKFVKHKDGNIYNNRADNLEWGIPDRNVDFIYGETWKDVVGYEDAYEVSSIGRVYAKPKVRGNTTATYKGHLIKQNKDKNGYFRVTLSHNNSKPKLIPVHRLVAEAFIYNKDQKATIDHINTNKEDNRIENLRWSTNKENINNPLTLKHKSETHKGAKNSMAQAIYSIDVETGNKKEYSYMQEAADELNVKQTKYIGLCCKGLMNVYKGKRWYYKK